MTISLRLLEEIKMANEKNGIHFFFLCRTCNQKDPRWCPTWTRQASQRGTRKSPILSLPWEGHIASRVVIRQDMVWPDVITWNQVPPMRPRSYQRKERKTRRPLRQKSKEKGTLVCVGRVRAFQSWKSLSKGHAPLGYHMVPLIQAVKTEKKKKSLSFLLELS